jgi:hypothetical protein
MSLLGLRFSGAMRDNGSGYAILCGGFGHIKFEKSWIAHSSLFLRFQVSPQVLNNLRRNCMRQKGRDGVSNLPETVPFCDVEPKPIRV